MPDRDNVFFYDVGADGFSLDDKRDSVKENDLPDALDRLQADTGLDIGIHVDGASGAFLAPFCAPDLEWDFRLPRVKSISTCAVVAALRDLIALTGARVPVPHWWPLKDRIRQRLRGLAGAPVKGPRRDVAILATASAGSSRTSSLARPIAGPSDDLLSGGTS